jgi:hypothetical protein
MNRRTKAFSGWEPAAQGNCTTQALGGWLPPLMLVVRLQDAMPDAAPVETRLVEHIRGERCPFEVLLSTGVLPQEWAQDYLTLLKEAQQRWQQEPRWPKELVAAVHIASTELDVRYRAWCGFGRGPRNEKTERLLNEVRISSEFFLLSPVTEPNRVAGRIDLPAPTPPSKRVRTRRFRSD